MKCKTCFGIKSKFVKMESIPTRASGEIGRRARLRSVWSKSLEVRVLSRPQMYIKLVV